MSHIDHSSAWFELRTQRGNTIVMKDDELPAANKGRIYLFNTERKAIVEYDPNIVSPKLFELDASGQSNAESQFGPDWLKARTQFMKKHGKHIESYDDETETKSKKISAEAMTDDDEDDDYYDDDED
jgi:hypothetical protein